MRSIALLLSTVLLTGCASPRIANPKTHQQIVDTLRSTLDSVRRKPFPDYLMSTNGVKNGTEFDVSVFMKAFPNLSLPHGTVLDWVYNPCPGTAGSSSNCC